MITTTINTINCVWYFFVDTESLYSECTQVVLDPFGITFTKSVKTKMMGTPKLEAAKILIDELNVPLKPEEFSHQLYSQLYEKFPHVKYMPGINVIIFIVIL